MVYLHEDKALFKQFIDNLNARTGIDADIIEKDYYVCLILKDLSSKQSWYKAYFKGGTALYKIMETMNRFSEDIDLTVEVIEEQSKNMNKKRLENAAYTYNLRGLKLLKDYCRNKKGSVTGVYAYESIYDYSNDPLHKPGIIQVEATSFTVSEPYSSYLIEPLIYKLATKMEKEILENKYGLCPFEILIITLERIFIDKVFAAEFYYTRNMYYDTTKHLYDIAVLLGRKEIVNFLNNEGYLIRTIAYKRREEKARKGGISEEERVKDFSYFKFDFSKEFILEYYNMQDKYLLNPIYKISMEELVDRLLILKRTFQNLNL